MESVVVSVVEDEAAVVDVAEVSDRGVVERVPEKEISLNGGISGLTVGFCFTESTVGERKALDLKEGTAVFLGAEEERKKGIHMG